MLHIRCTQQDLSEAPPSTRTQEHQRLLSEAAFEAWFGEDISKYRPHLYALALRRTHDPFIAEDLVQDTYVKALRFASQFSPESNVKAWLVRILTTTWISYLRRPIRDELPLSVLDQDGTADASLPETPGAETCLLDTLLAEELQEAIDALPLPSRTAFLLAAYYDRSYREIAEQEQVPIGTIMSRILRAKVRLQRVLQAHSSRKRKFL